VDTHAHLGLCEPDDAELVGAAREAGVRRILTVGLDESSNRAAIASARSHPEVRACVGRHPNSTNGYDQDAADAIARLAEEPEVVAIGETGLDFYREGASQDEQRRAFASQIEIAREAELPVVIHVRDRGGGEALAEVFDMLDDRAGQTTVILHCFSGSARSAAEAGERGWYCSFAGNVTYPSAGPLREAARAVRDELLLCETDSPFLAPQTVRGRPNQPARVVETARVLAAERGVSHEELERLIEANAGRAFGW